MGAFGYPDDDPFYPPGLYADNFLYTPLSAGDTMVRFLELSPHGGEIWSVPDSIVIHQVPEPMTIILIGLGWLMLRKRK